jgi:D-amino peptidase
MKFKIGVDLEGVACAVGKPDQPFSESKNYEFACNQAVREVNAAVSALFDCDATEVYVWDNHGEGLNLPYDKLDERCQIVLGRGFSHRWPGMDNTFSGALLIGYHPMDNTINGIMCHTFSSVSYQWIKINAAEVGEIAIDAAMANEVGRVPVIFVSSDYEGTVEAKKFLPWVETVFTKKGLSRNGAVSKHPVQAAKEIYEGVKCAVSRIDQMKIFCFSSPIMLQSRYKRMEAAQNISRDPFKKAVLLDPYTVERTVENISELY